MVAALPRAASGRAGVVRVLLRVFFYVFVFSYLSVQAPFHFMKKPINIFFRIGAVICRPQKIT